MAEHLSKCKHCGRREGWEVRGVLALLVVLLTFGLAYIQVIKGASETLIPPWAGVILGSVVSTYFMARGGEIMRDKTNDLKDLVSKGGQVIKAKDR